MYTVIHEILKKFAGMYGDHLSKHACIFQDHSAEMPYLKSISVLTQTVNISIYSEPNCLC